MHPTLQVLLPQILRGTPAPASTVHLLPELLPRHILDIMAAARVQASCTGKVPFTCGIINAKSGHCAEDCSFCAQSRHHAANVPSLPRVSLEALLARADELSKAGAARMGIVTSGSSPSPENFDFFCSAAQSIFQRTGLELCASFGIISQEQALSLRQAGFSSYHHNLETARSFFPSVCGTHTYEQRVQTVKNAQAAGLRVCSGGIFGLGESWAQRIELARTLCELGVDSIPVNFLVPISGTPLEHMPLLHPEEALGVIALIRLMHPAGDVVVCGGRNTVLGHWDHLLFSAGANGIMVGDYLTTKGGSLQSDIIMLRTLGLRP